MQAITIQQNSFVVDEVPDPVPTDHQVVVRTHAAGLNAADLLQAQGAYPAPPGWPTDIPGLELAGVIDELGDQVTTWSLGDRVMGLVGGGTHAQRLAVPADTLLPIPDGLDDTTAAGFTEAFSTAWDGLVEQAAVRPGERVLVTGAAGGVGTAMVQVAAMAGAEVVASVRRETLHAPLSTLVPTAQLVTPDHEHEHGPYDLVVELVGGQDSLQRISWLRPYGRVLVIGVGAGHHVPISLFDLMVHRARLIGSTIRARSNLEKANVAQQVRTGLLPGLTSNTLQVPIDSVHPLATAHAAYERVAVSGKFGKVILRTD